MWKSQVKIKSGSQLGLNWPDNPGNNYMSVIDKQSWNAYSAPATYILFIPQISILETRESYLSSLLLLLFFSISVINSNFASQLSLVSVPMCFQLILIFCISQCYLGSGPIIIYLNYFKGLFTSIHIQFLAPSNLPSKQALNDK